MDENTAELELFYALSVALTGFSLFDLRGTGVGTQYLAALKRYGGAASSELLERFRAIAVRSDGSRARLDHGIRVEILSDPTLGPLARNVIKLWYLGSWDLGDFNTPIISAEAYQEGLVWKAIEAHPMGAKQQGWGSWAEKPGLPLVSKDNLVKR